MFPQTWHLEVSKQRLQKLITWGFCLLTLINFELLEFQHCGGDKDLKQINPVDLVSERRSYRIRSTQTYVLHISFNKRHQFLPNVSGLASKN